jgi:hypothetical protein
MISVSLSYGAEWELDVEGGLVTVGLNDVQIPNETGTRFSLVDDLEADSREYYRIRLSGIFGGKHTVSALYAPLTLNAGGVIDDDILYNEVLFPAGDNLNADYTFNSYRLTYRYRLVDNDRLAFGLGFTGKIRDAEVKVTGDDQSTAYDNVGFVPLLNFRLFYHLNQRIGLLLQGDALASPGGQGRAEDVTAALVVSVNNRIMVRGGYRILEGGADVDDVYNFALLHYASAGLTVRF